MSDTAPSSDPQQVEAARFRSAVSESLLQKMQANINYLLSGSAGLGTVEMSVLDETTFNAQKGGGANWVLLDGRNVSTSAYAVLTGFTTVPDMRGRYPRMKDHGAGVDTAGDLATGSVYADQVGPHQHGTAIKSVNFGGGPQFGILIGAGPQVNTLAVYNSLNTTGMGSEGRVRTTVLNFFIRVD